MKRIRGKTLQRINAIHLRRYPLCVACAEKGRHRIAKEVDHVIPLRKGGIESPDPFRNRQGLCVECHIEKSKRERGHDYRPKRTVGLDGWPIQDRGAGKISDGSKR